MAVAASDARTAARSGRGRMDGAATAPTCRCGRSRGGGARDAVRRKRRARELVKRQAMGLGRGVDGRQTCCDRAARLAARGRGDAARRVRDRDARRSTVVVRGRHRGRRMQHLDDRSGRDASVSGTGRAPRRVVERVPSIRRGASTLDRVGREARRASSWGDLNGDPLAKFVSFAEKGGTHVRVASSRHRVAFHDRLTEITHDLRKWASSSQIVHP